MMTRYAMIFICSIGISFGMQYQIFLGLGQSINESALTTEATNQLTHNTSSVNASGSYYYTNTRLGTYEGNIKDITSGYIGVEIRDDTGYFTFRPYASISYSQHVNIGSVGNIRDGNLRACGSQELPSTDNICYRNSFYTSQADSTGVVQSVPFNAIPSFANQISSNAFLINYGIGADIGFNIPISFIINRFLHTKIIPLRLGFFGGGGYEFSTISIGFWDNRTFNNTTSDNVVLNTNDTFYLAGGGWYARYGISMWITDHMRLDIFAKLSFAKPQSTRYYLQESTDTSVQVDSVYKQQVLVLEHQANFDWVWNFALNIMF